MTVKINSRKKKKQENIAGPRAQRDHVTYFNTVGKNDHDSSFSQAATQTIRYYLRIFFWERDRVVHTLFVAVCYPTKSGISKSDWKKYLNRNSDRHDFQIDLIISLINFAIALEWDDESKRLGWMHQSKFVPCDCGMCHLCLGGSTDSIEHKEKKRRVENVGGTCVNTTGCINERFSILGKISSY